MAQPKLDGSAGSCLLATCAIPQAFLVFRQGHANGVSSLLLLLWGGGELLTLAYVLPKLDWPLIMNYTVNLFSIAVIVRYKAWPRGT
jgi:hypothetical protein